MSQIYLVIAYNARDFEHWGRMSGLPREHVRRVITVDDLRGVGPCSNSHVFFTDEAFKRKDFWDLNLMLLSNGFPKELLYEAIISPFQGLPNEKHVRY